MRLNQYLTKLLLLYPIGPSGPINLPHRLQPNRLWQR